MVIHDTYDIYNYNLLKKFLYTHCHNGIDMI